MESKKEKKMKRQNRKRLIGTENILMVATWKSSWGTGEKGEGTKKYELVVTEQSQRYKVQHREYTQ